MDYTFLFVLRWLVKRGRRGRVNEEPWRDGRSRGIAQLRYREWDKVGDQFVRVSRVVNRIGRVVVSKILAVALRGRSETSGTWSVAKCLMTNSLRRRS